MTSLWMLFLLFGFLFLFFSVRRVDREVKALKRWRQLIEDHVGAAAADQEYV